MNNETLADIIREMRDLGALDEKSGDMIPRSLQALGLRTYADRFEAARKREQADPLAKPNLCRSCKHLLPDGCEICGCGDYVEAAEREHNRQYEPKCNWSIKDALALANTLANHGLRDGNADAASSCIYSLCRILSSHGNAAALRRALEDTEELLEHFAKPGTMLHSAFFLHMRDNRAALSAPPRNCDVGTAEEQARRFQLFCQAHRAFDAECSTRCPFVGTADINHCQSGWAQLPYKEEETRKKEEGAK